MIKFVEVLIVSTLLFIFLLISDKIKQKKMGAFALNIVLIGMPSSGKSSAGRLLAQKNAMEFIDTDSIIREKAKKPLNEIVSRDGLQKFLEIQNEVLKSINTSGCVISTGGSCVYNEEGMKHLKKNGKIIYLKVQYDELKKRIDFGRRFARKDSQSLADVFNERAPLYELYSDYTIDCSGKTVEEIAEEINLLIKETGLEGK